MWRKLHKTPMGASGFRVLDLTADEAEIVSTLGFSTSKAAANTVEEQRKKAYQDRLITEEKAYQAEVADELGRYYEHGNAAKGVARDLRKASKYKLEKRPTLSRIKASTLHVLDRPIEMRTTDHFDNVSAFNSMRLFAWRLHRLIAVTYKASPLVILLNSYGGLSYILELVVDLYNIGKATFFPTAEQRESMPNRWTRFLITAKKDERPMRMANAAVWFAVNLACFFMTGGVSAIVNTTFFAFDLCVDTYKDVRDYLKHRSLLKKLDDRINELTQSLNQLKKQPGETNRQYTDKVTSIQAAIDSYQFQREAVAKEQAKTFKLRTYFVIATTLVLIGMILFFFPPALPAIGLVGAKILGACFAFSGSVMTFGRRTKRKTEAALASFANRPKPKEHEVDLGDVELANLKQPELELENVAQKPRVLSNNAVMHSALGVTSVAPAPLKPLQSTPSVTQKQSADFFDSLHPMRAEQKQLQKAAHVEAVTKIRCSL